ncbi:hypothetical protein RND81_12G156900 [Saponaria officinalis]|uniref:CHHC U11-48K-type domain-containing protein n=1 Tax=Saponaria officinalis TaxID=3572 RepID=A0AAW1HB81_SAPOF
MNPHYPVPNSPFSLNSLNPNPNFFHPQFNWPPPPQFPPPQPPPPPPVQAQSENPILDLPNSISSLKTLIQSSNSTLQSLSSLLPSLSSSSNSLIQCPSNPNHWVPSSSLFLHSLNCPSSLEIGPIVETLQYPKTLKNDQNFIQHNNFVQSIDDPTSELCFSIDDYVNFDCNFFYLDCPGVVSSSISDASNRMFTLPGVLSVECANFVYSGDKKSVGFDGSVVKVLPSEIWFVEREIEQWSNYPNEYSLSVCRSFSCVECIKECDLLTWVIENSPRFGIAIDVHIRDHLCVLFRLCLKAMVREAVCSYGCLLKSRIDDDTRNCNQRSLSFKCPVLVDVLRWLTSQLSILYGEMNSRSFVIAMLRHVLSKAASNASLFPLDRKVTENDGKDCTYELMLRRPIFVYQVAAAIAALHERSSLEQRIRSLRNPPQTPYQRFAQHSLFSTKADEERHKRPDYRAVIEHDSLLNQRQNDQGGYKPKTKEELLAEERDYKRRRMSYRGKKSKRAPKEVMRDIIEEYMETIKPTGSVASPTKQDAEGAMSKSDMLDDCRTPLDNDYNDRYTKPVHTSGRLEQHKESYRHGRSDDRRTTSRDRRDRDFDSRSSSKDRRRSQSRERRSHSKNRVFEEFLWS